MGSKKRKASKKKTKMGDGEDSNAHHSNSSTTHSHASEEPRSFDERESDGGEFEREEEEKGEEEVVDQLDGDAVKGKGLEEEVVRVEMEAKSDENGSGSAEPSSVSVEKEIHTLPGIDVVEDKEVTVVEEEQSIVPEFGDEIPKAVDHVFEVAVGVGGGFVEEFRGSVEEQIPGVESLKEVVAPPQEVCEGVSDVADLEFVKNSELVSCVSDDKENFSSDVIDQQPEKIEAEVASLDEDKSLTAPDVDTSKVNVVETLETGEQLEEKVIAPETTTIDETDSVKDGEVQMQSHDNGVTNTSHEPDNGEELEKVIALDTTTPDETDNVKDGEVQMQSHDNGVADTSSHEVDNGKELERENEKQSEEKPLINSNPLPVRRTSWAGCCGLFEVFSASNR